MTQQQATELVEQAKGQGVDAYVWVDRSGRINVGFPGVGSVQSASEFEKAMTNPYLRLPGRR